MNSIFGHLPELLRKHNVAVRGLIHVGAHKGEGVATYLKMTEGANILLIEPNPNFFQEMDSLRNVYGVHVRSYAIKNVDESLNIDAIPIHVAGLHITKDSNKSSLLKPISATVSFEATVQAMSLRGIALEGFSRHNVLVIDVQGSELDVLKSADLDQFDAIVCELTDPPRYEGASTNEEVITHLLYNGFAMRANFPHDDEQIVDSLWVKNK